MTKPTLKEASEACQESLNWLQSCIAQQKKSNRVVEKALRRHKLLPISLVPLFEIVEAERVLRLDCEATAKAASALVAAREKYWDSKNG
jgi:hypothetical protein